MRNFFYIKALWAGVKSPVPEDCRHKTMIQSQRIRQMGILWLSILCLGMSLLCLAGCGRKDGEESALVRVGSMKGPTTLGLLPLMEHHQDGEAEGSYQITVVTTADELLPMVIRKELDIALVPANVAAVLYERTEGQVAVIDINTLGVLYMVSGDTSVESMADLKGRTIYLTGKGTTPDFVLQYLLAANGVGLDQVTLEYKSEATEVAVLLANEPDAVGVLPQPFSTAACAQNKALAEVLDLTAQWQQVQEEGGSSLVTGVTVVRKGFLEEHSAAVELFMAEHAASAAYVKENVEAAAALAVEAGIIAKESLAVKALPKCNITYLDGKEMRQALEGYLKVLYELSPEAVGGKLPGEEFYYEKK